MPRQSTDTGGGGFTPEFGSHDVICCQLVDFGTHDKEWKGKTVGKVNKVNFGFEFINETMDGENGEFNPIWGAQFTNSLSKKANLRGILEGWRGKQFTEEELKGFDLSKLLGMPCTLVIQPNTNGNPKIQAIMRAKDLVGKRDVHEYWVEEGCFENEIPDWMPEWMMDEIKSSYEFRVGFDFDTKEAEQLPNEQPSHIPPFGDDDDIPF